MPATKPADKSDEKILYVLVYVLTIVSGIIAYVTVARKNPRLEFHAIQAIFLGVVMIAVSIIGSFIFVLAGLLNFLIWVYGIYIGYQAYKGEDVEIPVIADYAKRYSGHNPSVGK